MTFNCHTPSSGRNEFVLANGGNCFKSARQEWWGNTAPDSKHFFLQAALRATPLQMVWSRNYDLPWQAV
ncbi:hypothetical protein SLA2020_427530 [Shorea laevis]